MPPIGTEELEVLLRAGTNDGDTLPAPRATGALLRRLELYAEFFRLAPPPQPGSHGRLLLATQEGMVRAVPIRPADDPIAIGRNADCAVRLNDPEASRRHCRLGATADGAWIEDTGSANGTWLNDARLETRAALRAGDVIRVGRTLLVFDR